MAVGIDRALLEMADGIRDHEQRLRALEAKPMGGAGVSGSVPWSSIIGKPASFTPSLHKTTHQAGGTDVVTPAMIGAQAAGAAAGGDMSGTYPNPTVGANKVTNAKLATMGAHTMKGNTSGATTTPSDISMDSLKIALAISPADIGAIPSGSALAGDVSGVFSSTLIGANKVSNAKLAKMAATTVKANITGDVADPQDITISDLSALIDLELSTGSSVPLSRIGPVTGPVFIGRVAGTVGSAETLSNSAAKTLLDIKPVDIGGFDAAVVSKVISMANDALHRNDVESAATANISVTATATTLTSTFNSAGYTIDGKPFSPGSRILVMNQTDHAQNGIYQVSSFGSVSTPFVLTRVTDFDSPAEIVAGAFVYVQFGAVNGGKTFHLTTTATVTVGTTALDFAEITSYQAPASTVRANLQGTLATPADVSLLALKSAMEIGIVPQTPYVVHADGTQTLYATIQLAIDGAFSGEKVMIPGGKYAERLVMKEGVNVSEASPGTVSIDGVETANNCQLTVDTINNSLIYGEWGVGSMPCIWSNHTGTGLTGCTIVARNIYCDKAADEGVVAIEQMSGELHVIANFIGGDVGYTEIGVQCWDGTIFIDGANIEGCSLWSILTWDGVGENPTVSVRSCTYDPAKTRGTTEPDYIPHIIIRENATRLSAVDGGGGAGTLRTLGTGSTQAAAGDHTHELATTEAAGFMSADDKILLAARPPIGKESTVFFIDGALTGMGLIPNRIYNLAGVDLEMALIAISLGTAPTGQAVIVDILMDGESIFSTTAHRPKIEIDATYGSTDLIDSPIWTMGSYLQVQVVQYGSTIPGTGLTVEIARTDPSGASAPDWTDVTGKPDTYAPTNHGSSHGSGGSDPLSPTSIGAATTAHHTTHQTGGSDAITAASIGAAAAVHKTTHYTGGSDELAPSDIGAATAGHTHTAIPAEVDLKLAYIVNESGSIQYATMEDAAAAAVPGDLIVLGPGKYLSLTLPADVSLAELVEGTVTLAHLAVADATIPVSVDIFAVDRFVTEDFWSYTGVNVTNCAGMVTLNIRKVTVGGAVGAGITQGFYVNNCGSVVINGALISATNFVPEELATARGVAAVDSIVYVNNCDIRLVSATTQDLYQEGEGVIVVWATLAPITEGHIDVRDIVAAHTQDWSTITGVPYSAINPLKYTLAAEPGLFLQYDTLEEAFSAREIGYTLILGPGVYDLITLSDGLNLAELVTGTVTLRQLVITSTNDPIHVAIHAVKSLGTAAVGAAIAVLIDSVTADITLDIEQIEVGDSSPASVGVQVSNSAGYAVVLNSASVRLVNTDAVTTWGVATDGSTLFLNDCNIETTCPVGSVDLYHMGAGENSVLRTRYLSSAGAISSRDVVATHTQDWSTITGVPAPVVISATEPSDPVAGMIWLNP